MTWEKTIVVVIAWWTGSIADCEGGTAPSAPEDAEQVRSETPRETVAAVSESDRALLAGGNQAFALDLYHELASGEDGRNLFLSPFSISMALAMTYAGAEGQTEAEMASALHLDLPEPAIHAAFNAVDQELQSRGEDAQGTDQQPFQLHIVNQNWGQRGFTFLEPFLQTLAAYYGAGMFLLDFRTDPEGARGTINDWVAQQTEDRIRELLPTGVVTTDTRLILTNAIYFNAAWDLPFEPSNTDEGPFYTPQGQVSVPLMRQSARLRYAEGDGYQAVELPYDDRRLRFIAVLPAEGRFDEIEQGFDVSFLEQVRAGLTTHQTTVVMPRFEFETPLALKGALERLGMIEAFSPGLADFSGMDGRQDLFVQDVVHKAFISVDEAGTEAAAATAVVIGLTSLPQPAQIRLDRPFLFLILDEPTGQVLFLGRLLEP